MLIFLEDEHFILSVALRSANSLRLNLISSAGDRIVKAIGRIIKSNWGIVVPTQILRIASLFNASGEVLLDSIVAGEHGKTSRTAMWLPRIFCSIELCEAILSVWWMRFAHLFDSIWWRRLDFRLFPTYSQFSCKSWLRKTETYRDISIPIHVCRRVRTVGNWRWCRPFVFRDVALWLIFE